MPLFQSAQFHQAKYHLVEEALSLYVASFQLNETPLSYLKYKHSHITFQELTDRK